MQDYSLILKENNLKITPKRITILEILASNPCYMTAEDVWKKIKNRFKKIGLPTIYRNLEELSACGVISKIIHDDRRLYYFFCKKKEHHHHFICLSCKNVEEISICHISEIKENIENTLQGKVLNHILQINGLCNKCLNSNDYKQT
jgi:Fur family zinc uptake transcriptional regulator/Fur family ferric uptake transcriptional regulator